MSSTGLSTSTPDPVQVRRQAATAIRLFREAAEAAEDQMVLLNAIAGVECLCRVAGFNPNLRDLAPDVALLAPEVVDALVPLLLEKTEGSIPPDDIYFGLACASALLTEPISDLHHDRLNYAHLLAANLRIVFHKQNLTENGNLLTREVHIQRLMCAPRPPGETTH